MTVSVTVWLYSAWLSWLFYDCTQHDCQCECMTVFNMTVMIILWLYTAWLSVWLYDCIQHDCHLPNCSLPSVVYPLVRESNGSVPTTGRSCGGQVSSGTCSYSQQSYCHRALLSDSMPVSVTVWLYPAWLSWLFYDCIQHDCQCDCMTVFSMTVTFQNGPYPVQRTSSQGV